MKKPDGLERQASLTRRGPGSLLLEATLEAQDTSPLILVHRIEVAVGNFRLDEQVLDRVPLQVRGSGKDLAVGVGELEVPLQLFVDRNASAAPNGPVTPAALRCISNRASRTVKVRAGILVQLLAIGVVTTHQEGREYAEVSVDASLDSAFFDDRVVTADNLEAEVANLVTDTGNGVRSVVVGLIVCPPAGAVGSAGAAGVAVFDRDHSRETVAGIVVVADLVQFVRAVIDHVVVDDVAGIADVGVVLRVSLTDEEATEADVGEQQLGAGRVAFAPIPADNHVGLQRTVFGVGSGIDVQLSTGVPQRALLAVRVVGIVPLALGADAAADLEAGFRARNEEVASTVCVADANVFQRLRLSSDDSVGCLGTGYCCQRSSGAEKKALDVHYKLLVAICISDLPRVQGWNTTLKIGLIQTRPGSPADTHLMLA
ncbi:hypothetical protein RHSP_54232 [Rhizobium freirei PRF 81]|uniref:Uncharacterized protein n=1 Tax=Rhizobium freirei PRF 81 TaxID=363754 RepID=N6TXY8_9HYPH|nr:hypothetical protein RHSP_54232 [Rhizobium freirei PRF 81]